MPVARHDRRRIYLVRHGHVDYFGRRELGTKVSNVPLTDRGRQEAEAAGMALAHIPLDLALTSPLTRAADTAEAVLRHQSGIAPALTTDERLVEVKGGGSGRRVRLLPREAIAALVAQAFDTADRPGARMGPDGELFQDAYNRAVNCVAGHVRKSRWRSALIGTHEGINRMLLGWASGAGLSAMGAFEQDTGCINILDMDIGDQREEAPARVMIKAVNLTPYNYLKHGMDLTSLEAIVAAE